MRLSVLTAALCALSWGSALAASKEAVAAGATPPYAVSMEPMVPYSQRDPLYHMHARHSTQRRHAVAPHATGHGVPHGTAHVHNRGAKNRRDAGAYGAPPPPYEEYGPAPEHHEYPEPIIEIIIKESNESLPAPPPLPALAPKKPAREPVHVFYVKYKQTGSGEYGKDGNSGVVFDDPIPALTPAPPPEEEEEHGHHQAHYEEPVTPAAPRQTTTLRAIIHPDSELAHPAQGSEGKLRVTFGGPHDDEAHARPSAHTQHGADDKHDKQDGHEEGESAQQPVAAFPAIRFPEQPENTHHIKRSQQPPAPHLQQTGFGSPAPAQAALQHPPPPPPSGHQPGFQQHFQQGRYHQDFPPYRGQFGPPPPPPGPLRGPPPPPPKQQQPQQQQQQQQQQPAFLRPQSSLDALQNPRYPPFAPAFPQDQFRPRPADKPQRPFDSFRPNYFPQQSAAPSRPPPQFVPSAQHPARPAFQHPTRPTFQPQPHQVLREQHQQQVLAQQQQQALLRQQQEQQHRGHFQHGQFAAQQQQQFAPQQPQQSFAPQQSHPQPQQAFAPQQQQSSFATQQPQPSFAPQQPQQAQPSFAPHQPQQPQATFAPQQPQQQSQQAFAPHHPQPHPQQPQQSFAAQQPSQQQLYREQQLKQQALLQQQQQQQQQQQEQFVPQQAHGQTHSPQQSQRETVLGSEIIKSIPQSEEHVLLNQGPFGQTQTLSHSVTHNQQQHQQHNQQQHNQQQHHQQQPHHSVQVLNSDQDGPRVTFSSSTPSYSASSSGNSFATPSSQPSYSLTPSSTTPSPPPRPSPRPTTTSTTTTTEEPAPSAQPTTEEPKIDLTKKLAELPDEVPDDIREQLISSGILGNADIQILDYDKIGDTSIDSLPQHALENFYANGGQASASEPVASVVAPPPQFRPRAPEPVDAEPSASEIDEVVQEPASVPQASNVEMKVVRYDPATAEGQQVADQYLKKDAAVLNDPVVLNDNRYNRYLPLKISGAAFPLPDAPLLRGRNVTSVVVLAPVDYDFLQAADDADAGRVGRAVEVHGVRFVAGDALKTLVRTPTQENYRRWLQQERQKPLAKQSVILLVTSPTADADAQRDKEIFMYDASSDEVSRLTGELSSSFVEVAESNALSQDLENVDVEGESEAKAEASERQEVRVAPPEDFFQRRSDDLEDAVGDMAAAASDPVTALFGASSASQEVPQVAISSGYARTSTSS